MPVAHAVLLCNDSCCVHLGIGIESFNSNLFVQVQYSRIIFNFSILVPILSCSPDSFFMISMDATFCCFLFHDYRIDRCGLLLKEFVELAPLLPKLSQLEALRYNSCSKYSFTSEYLLPVRLFATLSSAQ